MNPEMGIIDQVVNLTLGGRLFCFVRVERKRLLLLAVTQITQVFSLPLAKLLL